MVISGRRWQLFHSVSNHRPGSTWTRNLLAWKVGHDDKNFQLPPLLVISTNQMQAKSIFCGSGITKDHGGYSTTDYSSTVSSQKHCQDSTFLSLESCLVIMTSFLSSKTRFFTSINLWRIFIESLYWMYYHEWMLDVRLTHYPMPHWLN